MATEQAAARGQTIQIVEGTYGANCGAPAGNVTGHNGQACNGRTQCAYTIDYKVIGDPAYGCAKDYVVRWQCSASGAIRSESEGPEAGWGDTSILLSCP